MPSDMTTPRPRVAHSPAPTSTSTIVAAACTLAVALAAPAAAQYATFTFEGVVERESPATFTSLFDVGDAASGSFTVNLSDFESYFDPDQAQFGSLGVFYDYSATVRIGRWSAADTSLAFANDDRTRGDAAILSPGGRPFDLLVAGMGRFGTRQALLILEGADDWLSASDAPDAAVNSLNLEQVRHARIVFSGPGQPVVVRLTAIRRRGMGLLSTPNQPVAQFAAPHGILDEQDFLAFTRAHRQRKRSADLALPRGRIDSRDVAAFTEQAARVPTR